jgi:hypothetical protein
MKTHLAPLLLRRSGVVILFFLEYSLSKKPGCENYSALKLFTGFISAVLIA